MALAEIRAHSETGNSCCTYNISGMAALTRNGGPLEWRADTFWGCQLVIGRHAGIIVLTKSDFDVRLAHDSKHREPHF